MTTARGACRSSSSSSSPPQRSAATLDIPGALLLSAGLICILVGLTEGRGWGWDSGRFIGAIATGLVILLIWGWVESRTRQPMVDMRIIADAVSPTETGFSASLWLGAIAALIAAGLALAIAPRRSRRQGREAVATSPG